MLNPVPQTTLPIHIDRPISITNLTSVPTPWGAPLFYEMRGHDPDDVLLKQFVLATEWPIPEIDIRETQTKQENEQFIIDKIQNDCFFANGKNIFDGLERGGDPPDYYFEKDGKKRSLDLSVLTLRGRREINAGFAKIKQTIERSESKLFQHLRGYVIYFWWRGMDAISKPHLTQESLRSIFETLHKYKPQPIVLDYFSPFGEHPEMHVAEGLNGLYIYAVPMHMAAPKSRFFLKMGFELGLAYTTHFSCDELINEFDRIVARHDKDACDTLVISAGAPDRSGLRFLTEERLIHFLIEANYQPKKTKFISEILVHQWTTGTVFKVEEKLTEIIRGRFQSGFLLSHSPLPPIQQTLINLRT